MKTLRYATIAFLAAFTLAACSNDMHDDKMMEKDKKMSMSDDTMAKDKMMTSVVDYAKEQPEGSAKVIRSWLTKQSQY